MKLAEGLRSTRTRFNISPMGSRARYIMLALALLFVLHFTLVFTHEEYGRTTSLSTVASKLASGGSKEPEKAFPASALSTTPSQTPSPSSTTSSPLQEPTHQGVPTRRVNATLLMLARNTDLEGAVKSVRRLEDRFNHEYKYPWVFLNEVPFTEEFKRRISILTNAEVHFGVIPHEHWFQPDWIDEEKAAAGRANLVQQNIIYGGSVSYRNMCRFNSGFFFRHPLLEKFRWYWRVEPDVDFMCNINDDPFAFMEANNKTYSFTISLTEFRETVETLWDATMDFVKDHPEYVASDNSMGFVSDNGGSTYNLCHFWSNFEIADMDFWRSPAYSQYFEHLDKQGGFYYERWGDAPVHSIAAALFLPKNKIHFFENIGYEHNPFNHCPLDNGVWEDGKCSCDPDQTFDYAWASCKRNWDFINW